MVTPLQFRDKIAEMIGGKGVLLMQAGAILRTLGSPQAPSTAVAAVMRACKDLLKAPLYELLDRHLAEVREEYMLMEGERPDEGDDETTAMAYAEWLAGLNETELASMDGEISGLVGATRLYELVYQHMAIGALVDAVLSAPIADTDRALKALGVTPEDLETLVREATPPVPVAVFGKEEFADLVRAKLDEGEDLLDLDEIVIGIVCATTEDGLVDNIQRLTSDEVIAGLIFTFVNMRSDTSIKDDEALATEIVALASQPKASWHKIVDTGDGLRLEPTKTPSETPTTKPIISSEPVGDPRLTARRTRGRPSAGEPDAVSNAAQAALVALTDFSAATEKGIADALGVSRAQMNNYRHGKNTWHPSEDQAMALQGLMSHYIGGLTEAREAFDLVRL